MKRCIISIPWIVLFALTSSCATLMGSDQEEDPFTLSDTSEIEIKPVAYSSQAGLQEYQYKDKPFTVEWITCQAQNPKMTLAVMHRDQSGFNSQNFCDGWIAQAFLSEGFSLVTANRPGFGRSNGNADFAGTQSIEALKVGLTTAIKESKIPSPTGIWGYSSGAIAAAMLAREMEGIKFLLLGSGVYDLEEAINMPGSSYIKKELEALQKTGGMEALEDRSLAYDVSGLPKRIALYHGKNDKVVPLSQAEALRDSMLSEEYQVSLQVIDGITHDIKPAHHRKILKALGRSLQ